MTDEEKQQKLEQIRTLAREKKIVFAPQDRLPELRPWLEKIRQAIGIKSWWISNESTISDFCLEDDELVQMREELGVSIEHKDYLVDVAQRMKDAEGNDG